ncbi:DUF1330 domain-containing protein [Thermoproteota archaeon]
MSVFMIAELTIKNRELYTDYVNKARSIIEGYGGRYLVQSEKIESIAGGWKPERIVAIEFPTFDALKQCFTSTEYKEIAPMREDSTTSRAIIVHGN